MGSMDGVALAKAVRKAGGTMQIVFVTGYSDYIAEGYDVEALNYLMKPVDAAKLFDVLDKAVARMRRDSKCLDLQCAEGLMRIPLADIRYLDVRRNYVTVHTDRDYKADAVSISRSRAPIARPRPANPSTPPSHPRPTAWSPPRPRRPSCRANGAASPARPPDPRRLDRPPWPPTNTSRATPSTAQRPSP